VAKDGVTGAEMDKARKQYLRREIQVRESALRAALRLGHDAVYFNDPNLINTAITKYNAVTADDVKRVAQKYFSPSLRAVVITLPPAAGSSPAAQQQGGQ